MKTLIEQDFEDYEIVISDNSDGLETKSIIDNLNNPKIKYFKQNTLLSMNENFEFVVSKAIGEYVICIGDDDGLIINSLNYLYRLITKYKAKVVKCCGVLYYWKGSPVTKVSKIIYPKSNPVKAIFSNSILEKVYNAELDYFHLPMIYYGAIHHSVLKKIISIQGSIFADAGAVDVYSGLCIAGVEELFIVSDLPFTVAGSSGNSNGSMFVLKEPSSNEFFKLDKIQFKYRAMNVPEMYQRMESITWLCLEQFNRNFKISPDDFKINKANWIIKLNGPTQIMEKPFFKEETIAAFVKANTPIDWINGIRAHFKSYPSFLPVNFSFNTNYFDNHIGINYALFQIENVYDASRICYQIQQSQLNTKPIPLNRRNLVKWKYLNWIRKLKDLILLFFN